MNIEEFLQQDLKIVKRDLNTKIIESKCWSQTILHDLCALHEKINKVKYIFEFCKENLPALFLEKDNSKSTFLHNVFLWPRLKVLKYIFKFCLTHFPTLFLEKNVENISLFGYSYHIDIYNLKYVLKFFIRNFPFLFFEKDDLGHTLFNCSIDCENIPNRHWIFNFYTLNFPECSIKTNNFILPLMMEMQN